MGWGRGILVVACVFVLVADAGAPPRPDPPVATTTPVPVAEPEVPGWEPDEVSLFPRTGSTSPVWVFPDVLDEATRWELFQPELGYRAPNDDRAKRLAGGQPGYETEVAGVRRSLSIEGLTFTNKRRERVRLLDVRAVVLERRPPPTGTLLRSTGRTGTAAEFVVDLDTPDARMALTESGRPLLDVRYSTLEELESVPLPFLALTSTCDCLWELRLALRYDGSDPEEKVIRSDGTADGPPFRTTAWNLDRPYAGGVHEVEPLAFWPTGG